MALKIVSTPGFLSTFFPRRARLISVDERERAADSIIGKAAFSLHASVVATDGGGRRQAGGDELSTPESALTAQEGARLPPDLYAFLKRVPPDQSCGPNW